MASSIPRARNQTPQAVWLIPRNKCPAGLEAAGHDQGGGRAAFPGGTGEGSASVPTSGTSWGRHPPICTHGVCGQSSPPSDSLPLRRPCFQTSHSEVLGAETSACSFRGGGGTIQPITDGSPHSWPTGRCSSAWGDVQAQHMDFPWQPLPVSGEQSPGGPPSVLEAEVLA